MTEVQKNTAPKKNVEHEFSGTHFNLLIVADDQKTTAAEFAVNKLVGEKVVTFVHLDHTRETTSGRARGVAVDKILVAGAKSHAGAELYVTVSVPAAFARAMASGANNSFSRGTMQNVIDGLLGFRTLSLLDSITVYADSATVSNWVSPVKPDWAKLEHPKGDIRQITRRPGFDPQKPIEPYKGKVPVAPPGPMRRAMTANGQLPLKTGQAAATRPTEVLTDSDKKILIKLAAARGDTNDVVRMNRWRIFNINVGPGDDRNQQVAFDSLIATIGQRGQGSPHDVADEEIVEMSRLITSLESSAAPHEISNKQALGRLLGAVVTALGNDRYKEQLDDLYFALKHEQENGNDVRKQISMVANTGAVKFRHTPSTRPLLATVFEGLIRRVRGALRKRKQVAEAKRTGVEVPAVEAVAKKKKKRKKKAKPVGQVTADGMVAVPMITSDEGGGATAIISKEEAVEQGLKVVPAQEDNSVVCEVASTEEKQ